MTPFRAKKRVGQIYFGVPSQGRVWLEANAKSPDNLDPLIISAREQFLRDYLLDRVTGASDVPLSPAAWPWAGWEERCAK